ncbi:hypothetical protein [Chamaesiphon sp.]|uniref:hypothetical protein n=1 Tax=Chamaesiphon sp. TaxID=2814140 RepID=UPI0035946CDA
MPRDEVPDLYFSIQRAIVSSTAQPHEHQDLAQSLNFIHHPPFTIHHPPFSL